MSCAPGEPCEEGLKRRRALIVLGLMGVLFIALSAASFLDSRGQVVPAAVSYAGYDVVEGKRVFQAWNCMGCHTIVGNGAYLLKEHVVGAKVVFEKSPTYWNAASVIM